MEKYANNKSPGWGARGAKPPDAETLFTFGCGSCKFACILIFGDTKKHRYLQFA